MSKKLTYRFFAVVMTISFCFSFLGKQVLASNDDQETVKQELSTEKDQSDQVSISEIEATVPVLHFNLDVALIFIFEILELQPQQIVFSLYEEVLELSSYRSNLFCSTICVNAP